MINEQDDKFVNELKDEQEEMVAVAHAGEIYRILYDRENQRAKYEQG